MSNMVPFVKMNGIGNKIFIADMRHFAGKNRLNIAPSAISCLANDPATSFDQLMALYKSLDNIDGEIIIFNKDGSQAEACGNGMRCIGAWLAGETGRDNFMFATKGGKLEVAVAGEIISVVMGEPRFLWHEIPLAKKFTDTNKIELSVNPKVANPSVVNVGNPHAVFWLEDELENYNLGQFGAILENHKMFPQGANITLAKVLAKDCVKIKTWERGAGLTQACGSAACATLVCGHRTARLGRVAKIILPGGELQITWRNDNKIIMCGTAEHEFKGSFNATNGEWQYE